MKVNLWKTFSVKGIFFFFFKTKKGLLYNLWKKKNNKKFWANVLDSNIVVNEFEPQSSYCVHIRINNLGKGMNPLYPHTPAMGKIVPSLFFYKNWFDIK